MSTELAILEKRGIDEHLWSAIGSSIFPGASDESMLMAFDYCKARGLDIMKKPCHIVPMNVKDAKTGRYGWRDVIMPSIADHRITANRSGEYAGQSAPDFGPMVEMTFGSEAHTVPDSCTVTVYRMIGGERVPCAHTEYFEEACGTTKDGSLNSMWKKRKRGQLAKCAEAGALRKAFPEELGGMTTSDEIAELRDVTPDSKKIETGVSPRSEPVELDANPPSQEDPIVEEEAPVDEVDLSQYAQMYITGVEKSKGVNPKTQVAFTRYRVSLSNGTEVYVSTTFSTSVGDLALQEQDRFVMARTENHERGLKLLDLRQCAQPGEEELEQEEGPQF